MTVAVDLGSGAVKIAGGAESYVTLAHPVDAELAARVGTTVPLYRHAGNLVIVQAPHDAYARAVAEALGGMPAESVAIVAPDWWTKRAREAVHQTLEAHASGPFQLVSPAAAALKAARARHRLPSTVAVLDIGAESSSATVLHDADGVQRVVGPPAVLHGRAGNDIDRRLMHHVLGWLRADGHDFEPTDPEIAAAGESMLSQVKAAKERLSTRPAASLKPDLPGVSAELRLVRSEFDEVVRETVDAIVAMLKAVGTNATEGAEAVLLIGGSVSIPLVTQVISVELGLPVVLDGDPATLAVRGALTTELPAPPRQRTWRRRNGRHRSARNVFDLELAPRPHSEPWLDSVPISVEPAVIPDPPSEAEVADPETIVPEPERRETSAGHDTAPRLGSFIERSRREAVATRQETLSEPVHLLVETEDGPSPRRSTRWSSGSGHASWNSSRHSVIDADGQFRLRVNDRDHDVDMGQELASRPVTVLLIGLHVFVTASESGELLRELRLDPDLDFAPV